MRRLSSAFALLILLTGCSANWHLRKAISKDPAILTDGVVIERVTDTIEVYLPPIDTTVNVVIPADTLRGVAPLQKLIASGLTFENERQIVRIAFDPITEDISVEALSKEFHYPARVKFAGRWYRIPYEYDKTVIQPRVSYKSHIIWALVAFIVVAFLAALFKRPLIPKLSAQ
jgi:hypothetical protein